jgi:hypothetical protein
MFKIRPSNLVCITLLFLYFTRLCGALDPIVWLDSCGGCAFWSIQKRDFPNTFRNYINNFNQPFLNSQLKPKDAVG